MRAVWYEKKGPAREVLILGEKPTPAPAPGEVLIRVYASGVNPSDEGMRSGLGRAQNVEPFVIPQSDGAGIVEALGDGVTRHSVGDRVWLYNGQREGRQHGTGAEYIALNAERDTSPARSAFLQRRSNSRYSRYDGTFQCLL